MKDLIIEIGSEEIPAGYIDPALNAFSAMMRKRLADAGVAHGEIRRYATPRRLALIIKNVAETQETVSAEVTGPPESVAYDGDGKPLVPAVKFAEKVGIPLERIQIKVTDKGRYLYAEKTEKARPSAELLKTIIPEVIPRIPFPKTMKWADMHLKYTRPMHTILALFGEDVIPFTLERIESGNKSFGHRFMSPGEIVIKDADSYVEALRAADVVADFEERKKRIEKEIANLAAGMNGSVLEDPELLDTVANLVEFSAPVIGKFEEDYLEIPGEVLITAMREHQKYFAVIDSDQKLMACFIAVNNTVARDMDLVARGHERVLRARLADARFFYNSDRNTTFDAWTEKLKGVLFQASLGTMYDKTERLKHLAEYIAGAVGSDEDLKKKAVKAASICKADLVSQVVGEFPKLQGVMGRIYASMAGEPEEVAWAVEEHYRPTGSGGRLPGTMTGAVTAIADKIDSICGCFSIGLAPTGASDPHALRRQGIGVLQIMLDKDFGMSLKKLIETAVRPFQEKSGRDLESVSDQVYAFLKNRMVNLMAEQGFSKDIIAAATDLTVDNIPDAKKRIESLESLKQKPEFEPIAAAFKRVVNIIRKADLANVEASSVNADLFQDPSESALLLAVAEAERNVQADLNRKDFHGALLNIASLKDPVDAFFDGVMVMADDEALKINRLSLLKRISDLFDSFADFAKIST